MLWIFKAEFISNFAYSLAPIKYSSLGKIHHLQLDILLRRFPVSFFIKSPK